MRPPSRKNCRHLTAGHPLRGDVTPRGRPARDGIPVRVRSAERVNVAGEVRRGDRGDPAPLQPACMTIRAERT